MQKRTKKVRDEYYPTRWSEWEWNEQYQRDARYREVSKGKWEWEYAEPRAAEPHYEAYSQGTVQPTPWTPRRTADPDPALPGNDEQSTPYEEPSSSPNYRLDSGVSNITQGIADVSINPTYPDDPKYQDEPRYPEERQRDEKRKGKSSSYPEDRQGRDRKGKSRKGEPSHDKQSYNSDDYPEPYDGGSNQEYSSADYVGSQPETAREQKFEYPATQAGTAEAFHSAYPASQPPSTQAYAGYGPPSGQAASYATPNYSASSAMPLYGAQPSSYNAPPRAQDNAPRKIQTRHPKIKYEELDSRFKVHRSNEFKFGRVFKVLWSEPIGSGGTEITVNARFGEKAFHKIRRFLVVNNLKGHSICIPILTYGYQGVLKHGVHPHDHAVIYSSRRDGPYLLDREEGLMSKKPIRVEIKDPSHKLDPMSRLNYAKIYTVEHNVKVLFIGEVAKNYEQAVVVAFNDTHPPLSSRPYPDRPDSPDVYTRNAQGPDPSYPSAMPIPGAGGSSAWDSSGAQYPSTHGSNPSYPSYPTPTAYSGPGNQPYGILYNAAPQMPLSEHQPPTSQAEYDHSTPTYEDGYNA